MLGCDAGVSTFELLRIPFEHGAGPLGKFNCPHPKTLAWATNTTELHFNTISKGPKQNGGRL